MSAPTPNAAVVLWLRVEDGRVPTMDLCGIEARGKAADLAPDWLLERVAAALGVEVRALIEGRIRLEGLH